jgi:hypothetical protein
MFLASVEIGVSREKHIKGVKIMDLILSLMLGRHCIG